MADPVSWLTGISSALAGGAAIKSAVAKPPSPQKPKTMPVADDEAVAAARRRAMAEAQATSGRASTILSQDDRLGG